MAGGAGRQEIEYLVKKSWLDQYEETQKLNKDELWQLLTGHSPNEGKVHYFDLPQRMGNARIHFSLDYGVMKAVRRRLHRAGHQGRADGRRPPVS